MAITLTDKQAKDVRDLLYLGLQEIDDKIDLADHYGELTIADHRRLFDEYAAAEVTLCLLTGNTPERHGCEDEKFVELDTRAISDAANTIAVRILKGVALEAAQTREADANLCAAAPELLDCAEYLAYCIEPGELDEIDDDGVITVNMTAQGLRDTLAAIRKAKGIIRAT